MLQDKNKKLFEELTKDLNPSEREAIRHDVFKMFDEIDEAFDKKESRK